MTTALYIGTGRNRRVLKTGRMLGEGAAGKVYAVEGKPGVAVKLYHDAETSREHAAKIALMLASPPVLPPLTADGAPYPQIAWPDATVHAADGSFVGFTMPAIDFDRSTSLVNLLQKSSRRAEKMSHYYGYRVLVARNLASVFVELHRAGHHMIDMKPANLRFYRTVSWMAVVDTDGFSIAGTDTDPRSPATQVSDEYIAPESARKHAEALGIEQDLFAMAVIIFQLLNNGVHPFSGTAAGTAARDQPADLQSRIGAGLYGYAMPSRADIAPSSASIHRTFRRATREYFDRAFVGDPARRPTATEWRDHLNDLVQMLVPCTANPAEHAHFGIGCGFCAHDARMQAAAIVAHEKNRLRKIAEDARAAEARNRPRPVRGTPLAPAPRTAARRPSKKPAPKPTARQIIDKVRGSSRATRIRAGLWFGIVGALFFTLTSEQLWAWLIPEVSVTPALALTEITDAPPADIKRENFEAPRPYRVIGGNGVRVVNVRAGPGSEFDKAGALALNARVWASARSIAHDGSSWIWVTPEGGGKSGYVAERLLSRAFERAPLTSATPVPAPPAPASGDGSAAVLTARFTRMIAASSGAERAFLEEQHAEWLEDRARCISEANSAACRRRIDTVREASINAWDSMDGGVAAQPAAKTIRTSANGGGG